MAPKKSSTASSKHVNEDWNDPSTNAQPEDQILLKALQEIIVCVVDSKRANDINQISGPEARNLITALREFVTSIVRPSDTVVEVSLIDEGNAPQRTYNEIREAVPLPTTSSDKSYGGKIIGMNNKSQQVDASEEPQPTFQDKLLKGLREHVFNAMPIRKPFIDDLNQRSDKTCIKKITAPIMRRSYSGWMEFEIDTEAIERLISKYARYSILSHTWLRTSPEVTYGVWKKGLFDAKHPGYQKLINFGKVSWNDHKLTLGWMDTVCINKESSSELDESIRSMYNWYSRADLCITYLAETASLSDMHGDPWFTRGWTLQELLAPRVIKFYNSNWTRLVEDSDNDKYDLRTTEKIQRATTMSKNELNSIHRAPISRRMQLAATREVTREEDTAYSLMGVFNVSISTAYGEGSQRSFLRLLQEILQSISSMEVLDVLNWAGDLPDSLPHPSHILPSSPLHYVNSYHGHQQWLIEDMPLEPLVLTHMGLRVPVILMPAISKVSNEVSQFVSIGDYHATVDISPIQGKRNFHRILPNATYNVLDNRTYGGSGLRHSASPEYQITLAIFNISGDADTVRIFSTCLAKVIDYKVGKQRSSEKVHVFDTDTPTVFQLIRHSFITTYYDIKRDQLAKHGMQLVTLYL